MIQLYCRNNINYVEQPDRTSVLICDDIISRGGTIECYLHPRREGNSVTATSLSFDLLSSEVVLFVTFS